MITLSYPWSSAIDIIALIITLFVNFIVANNSKNDVRTISHKNPTKIVPADFTFAIWGPIYILITIYTVTRLLKQGDSNYERIGFLFTLSCVFNILWIFTWLNERYYIAQVAITALLIDLLFIYNKIDVRYGLENNKSLWDTIALNVAFSMYMAWLCVANIVSTAVTIAHIIKPVRSESTKITFFGIDDEIWSIIMQLVTIALVVVMILFRKDFVFAAVIAWALFGIRNKQMTLAPFASRIATYGSLLCIIVTIVTSIYIITVNRPFVQGKIN
jgi:hypothetical protein